MEIFHFDGKIISNETKISSFETINHTQAQKNPLSAGFFYSFLNYVTSRNIASISNFFCLDLMKLAITDAAVIPINADNMSSLP